MNKLLAVIFVSAFGTSVAIAQGVSSPSDAAGNDTSTKNASDRTSGAGTAGTSSAITSQQGSGNASSSEAKGKSGNSAGASGSNGTGSSGSSAEKISGTSGSSNSGGSQGSTDGGGAGVTTGISGAGIPGNLGTMDGTKGNNSPYIGAGATTSGSSGTAGSDKAPTTGTGIPSAAEGGAEKHLFRGQSPEPSKPGK